MITWIIYLWSWLKIFSIIFSKIKTKTSIWKFSKFIVKESDNSSCRLIRSSFVKCPINQNLLKKTGILFGLYCQPFADFCDSEKTHQINRDYREKDYPADIITFAIFADSEEKFVFDGEINLGEIIIALDKVEEESKKKGTTFNHELAFLISHGILHLLGFDHQTEEDYNFIIGLQNKALEYVKI